MRHILLWDGGEGDNDGTQNNKVIFFSVEWPRVHPGSPGHFSMSLSLLSTTLRVPQWQNKTISNIAVHFLDTINVTQNIQPKFHRITEYFELLP